VLEGLRYLFSSRPWGEIVRDVVDVVIVAYLCYRGLLVLRGTRAMQMGVGLVAFGVLYVVARYLELVTVLNVLSWIATSLILIVVVVFQNDIRRALIRVGSKAWFSRSREQETRLIDEVVEAATELARHRIGAIITFERDANLLEFVRSDGIAMDSLVTRELLVSLFLPESLNKTHDGAVLIRDLRIARAGVFFPMPESKVVDPNFGSRHRAAIGITEETDAVVVVVSEERGTITLCYQGSYVANVDGANLKTILLDQLGHRPRKDRGGPFGWLSALVRGTPDQADASAEAPGAASSVGAESPPSTTPERGRLPPSVRPPPVTVVPKSGGTGAGVPTSAKPVGPASGAIRASGTIGAATAKPTAAASVAAMKTASSVTVKEPSAAAGVKGTSELFSLAATQVPAAGRGVSRPMATPPPPTATLDLDSDATLTPAPSRVSRPMPVARDRRTLSDVSVEVEGITSQPAPAAPVGDSPDEDAEGPPSGGSPSSVPAVERIAARGRDEA
jgi:uncharacterized protein (TIGR00159 family)